MSKTTYFYPNKTLNLGGRILDLSTPKVMGILNVTPDSFFDGGRFEGVDTALAQAEKMISEGADILDIGGMSSKPGAEIISVEEELGRVIPVIDAVVRRFPETPLSVDTIHGAVVTEAVNHGALMVNDISAGLIDPSIIDETARLRVPYVLMHMRGIPLLMQESPVYDDVIKEVFEFLLKKSIEFTQMGIQEIMIDPGFGFGKSLEHNYALAGHLETFKQIGFPVLAGISRKSMICKLLKVNPERALNGTTALNTILLLKGADILRVHDVREATEVIRIVQMLEAN